MASFLKEAVDYLAGQIANLTKEDDTAYGNTDDKTGERQVDYIGAGSTDARVIANELFKSKVRIPAMLIASGDTYDVTQSYTRMNDIYSMTRDSYYKQERGTLQTRKNRLQHKQKIVSEAVKQSEQAQKAQYQMVEGDSLA